MSTAAQRSLDRHIERALRDSFGARTGMRTVVREVATEMLVAGASEETICEELTRSVTDHSGTGGWDRRSIVSGLRASDVLTGRILGWARQAFAGARVATPLPVGKNK